MLEALGSVCCHEWTTEDADQAHIKMQIAKEASLTPVGHRMNTIFLTDTVMTVTVLTLGKELCRLFKNNLCPVWKAGSPVKTGLYGNVMASRIFGKIDAAEAK